MRISDWSSDVCSSDLGRANPIVTTICFALSAAASGPLEVIRPRPAGKYVEVSIATHGRSEERRVGKECVSTCRSRCTQCHEKKKVNRVIAKIHYSECKHNKYITYAMTTTPTTY